MNETHDRGVSLAADVGEGGAGERAGFRNLLGRGPLQRSIVLRELALVLIVGLVQIGGTAAAADNQPDHGPFTIGGGLLLAVAALALPFRLRFPVWAAWTAKFATLAYWSLDLPRGPVWFALIITFGNLLFSGRRWHAVAIAVTGFVTFSWLPALLGNEDAPTAVSLMALAAWLVVLFTVSELIRARRDQKREEARSEAEVLQRQVATERLRMARELHDVVAHNMSLINLQAGVALHLADDAPPAVRDSLDTIKTASKEALVELRSILGVLRHVDDDVDGSRVGAEGSIGGASNGAPRQPTPGLERLDELITRSRAAGVDITATVDVDVDRISRAVQLAAYRIVQESLTNVARHANPPTAKVSVRTNGDGLVIDVVDEGTGVPREHPLPSGGNGLPGMRERAASVGGHLTAGPRMGGGFAVNARLPLGQGDA